MPDTPHVPASDEVAWLRLRVAELEELSARLRGAAAARDELAAAQLAARDAQIAALAAQVEELQLRRSSLAIGALGCRTRARTLWYFDKVRL